jgi:hypothetical protein
MRGRIEKDWEETQQRKLNVFENRTGRLSVVVDGREREQKQEDWQARNGWRKRRCDGVVIYLAVRLGCVWVQGSAVLVKGCIQGRSIFPDAPLEVRRSPPTPLSVLSFDVGRHVVV